MKKYFFWRDWPSPYRQLYLVLLTIFGLSVCLYIITLFIGSSLVIHWGIETTVEPVRSLFDNYRTGLYEFPLWVENLVVSQGFKATELSIPAFPSYILVIWLGICISILLSLINDLSRFWFYVSMTLLILMFIGLKIDYLVLFGRYDKTGLIVAILLYIPSSYYFHVSKKAVFLVRLGTHLLATAVFGCLIYFFSEVSDPFMTLASYGIYVPLILTFLFIISTGHELISSFLHVITSSGNQENKNNLWHFVIFGLIYMVNLVLVLLRYSRILDLNIYLIGSFWLLIIVAILGIWGYKKREETYIGMYPFFPTGSLLYLCLGITSFLTISYLFLTANDALIEVMEDGIVFVQIGYSFMFMAYILVNFMKPLENGLNVSRFMYKPHKMPYFSSRFAGLVVVIALVIRAQMLPFYHVKGGFYNGIGDLYLYHKEHDSAREHYKIALAYAASSHRANYALAMLEKEEGNRLKAIEYLKDAVRKNPTEYAYVQLAQELADNDQHFESIFALQDGLKAFPGNGYISNNLALSYMKLQNIDSVYLMLDNALKSAKTKDVATANVFAMITLKDYTIKKDTLEHLLANNTYKPAVNNLVVLANNIQYPIMNIDKLHFSEPGEANSYDLVYNYNMTFNRPDLIDSVYLAAVDTFYNNSNVLWLEDPVRMAAGLASYKNYNLVRCFNNLNMLAMQNAGDDDGKYNNYLGKISLALGAPVLAIEYFGKAFNSGLLELAPELALAYMENHEFDKAAFMWQQIMSHGDTTSNNLAQMLLRVMQCTEFRDMLNENEETRFNFIKYRKGDFRSSDIEDLIVSMEDQNLQILSYLQLFDHYLKNNEPENALRVLEKTGTLNANSIEVVQDINIAQVKWAIFKKDPEMIRTILENVTFNDNKGKQYLALLRILENESKGRIENLSDDYYQLAMSNPFFEEAILNSVRYFNQNDTETEQAYNILVNAVNINKYSIPLNKAYVLQSVRMGLDSYAEEVLNDLQNRMSETEYALFEQEYQALLNAHNVENSLWN